MAADTSDLRNGMCFKYNGEVFQVVSFQHVKQGRGAAFVRVKMRNMASGRVIENSFNSGEKVETIRIEHRTFQYLYPEGDELVLMDSGTFEQINVNRKLIDGVEFLLEGSNVKVLWNAESDTPMTVEIPESVIQTVTYTEPGIKGDTATNAMKPATLESGAEVKVPLFINIGDLIKVDTSSRVYMERVKS
ncbi:MAG: elongation factor P [Bacteroidia bacterium]|nr:elongation factor P [Bacteroidia bacterium]